VPKESAFGVSDRITDVRPMHSSTERSVKTKLAGPPTGTGVLDSIPFLMRECRGNPVFESRVNTDRAERVALIDDEDPSAALGY
jgi:hypothetical protein